MGVVTYDFEVISPISPTRLFKALVLEADKLFPKAAPHAIKSVELEGNGGTGSIVKINFAEGLPFQYVKHTIEGQDKDNLSYSYSLVEGGPVGDKLEKISYENKFVAAANGGSVCKSLMKFYTVGDGVFTEEEIKQHIGRMDGVYKAIEAYLLANPDVCN
ncbi:Major allergen Pru av 1 [Hibiscus syriacus]|uniref:Major allergen Pru av 1 n=1 Tax=Hibiscus syriacus TaxID=106335 RepID=A0A6A3BN66_HIBSY|nr:major allergen Pru ar 1-like [Hibiscus syriacus]KAE8717785.1 Major allergen Pru av 1 [Hibiscus syriacus]